MAGKRKDENYEPPPMPRIFSEPPVWDDPNFNNTWLREPADTPSGIYQKYPAAPPKLPGDQRLEGNPYIQPIPPPQAGLPIISREPLPWDQTMAGAQESLNALNGKAEANLARQRADYFQKPKTLEEVGLPPPTMRDVLGQLLRNYFGIR